MKVTEVSLFVLNVQTQADHPNCSRDHNVMCDIRHYTFTVFHNSHTRLDSSDWSKCFKKHRILHLLIPNGDIM